MERQGGREGEGLGTERVGGRERGRRRNVVSDGGGGEGGLVNR